VSAEAIEKRFRLSRGADPIFRTNDGSDCRGQGRYTLLRSRGLFRVSLPIPDGAEFRLASIPPTFTQESAAPFDPTYMKALFKVGYALGARGNAWTRTPPEAVVIAKR